MSNNEAIFHPLFSSLFSSRVISCLRVSLSLKESGHRFRPNAHRPAQPHHRDATVDDHSPHTTDAQPEDRRNLGRREQMRKGADGEVGVDCQETSPLGGVAVTPGDIASRAACRPSRWAIAISAECTVVVAAARRGWSSADTEAAEIKEFVPAGSLAGMRTGCGQ